MSSENFSNEPALDRLISEIRDEQIDPHVLDAAAGRVWARIAGAGQPRLVDRIRSCDDFQALFADYRAGRLSEPRRLLVEDHTHACVACRKALAGEMKVTRFPAAPRQERVLWYRWAAAAVIVAGIGWGVVYYVNGPSGSRTSVALINGTLYRISEAGNVAVKAGEELPAGAEIRTAKDSGAVIRLRDGSLVEMRERSGFSVAEAGKDLTVNLGLGSIIVQAAKRHSGHLFVATRDLKVAVTGTVFSVNSGIKGSRVAVIEGEVHVTRDKDEKVLHPGEQFMSNANLTPAPIRDEIAWSRSFDQHMQVMKELVELQKRLGDVHFAEPRYDSRLMKLVPASTAIYVSVPNPGKALAEAQQVIRAQMMESPALAQWWARMGAHGFRPDAVIDKLREFSDYFGDEIVLAAPMDDSGKLGEPVILAELKRPGFREFAQHELDQMGHGSAGVRFIDDPAQATAGNGTLVLVRPDLVAISPNPEALRFGNGAFAATSLGAQVAESYRNGAGILFSADLERITRGAETQNRPPGLANIRSLLVEQKEISGRTDTRASVTFHGPRQGIFSWLAPPAPMRALDFVSPEAGFVAAFTMKTPAQVLQDLQANNTLKLDRELPELAATLGGEFAVAVDGPVFPPAWKLVVEVYDSSRLEYLIGKLVETHNQECAGKDGCTVQLTQEAANGRTYHTLKIPNLPFGDAAYTFVDGYLLAAANRPLLDRAIQYRATGYTLPRSTQFLELAPRDHYSNFSAMVYQNAGPQLGPLMGLLGQMNVVPPAQQKSVAELAQKLKPSLVTAYGEEDRITVASNGSLMGLSMNNLIQGNLGSFTRGNNFLFPGFPLPGTPRREPAYR
jgi:hypothetical protein